MDKISCREIRVGLGNLVLMGIPHDMVSGLARVHFVSYGLPTYEPRLLYTRYRTGFFPFSPMPTMHAPEHDVVKLEMDHVLPNNWYLGMSHL